MSIESYLNRSREPKSFIKDKEKDREIEKSERSFKRSSKEKK